MLLLISQQSGVGHRILGRQEDVRGALGCQIEDVGHRDALAEHLATTGDVVVIRTDHRPESLVTLPMDAVRSHCHARLRAVQAEGLVLIGVEHEVIDPDGQGPVGLILHVSRVVPVAVLGRGSERLRPHHRPPHRVGHRRRLDTTVNRIEFCRPKLTHGNIAHRAQVEVAGGVHVVELARVIEPVVVRIAADHAGVVLEHQFRSGLAQVPQEALRLLPRSHQQPGIGGQERLRIVAAPLPEFLAEGATPVLGAGFPTIQMQRRPAAVGMARPDFVQELLVKLLEVISKRSRIKPIRLEPVAGFRCRPGGGARAARGQTHDRPFPRRHFPVQRAIGAQARGEVQHGGGIDHSLDGRLGIRGRGWDETRHLFPTGIRLRIEKGFHVQ